MKRLLPIILIAALSLLSSGCKVRTVYVDKIKTEYKDRVRIDSVYERDSIILQQYTKGDTIFLDKEVVKWRTNTKIERDTVSKVDSIPYRVEVPAKLSAGQQMKLKVFWWLFGVAAVALLLVFRKPIGKILRI